MEDKEFFVQLPSCGRLYGPYLYFEDDDIPNHLLKLSEAHDPPVAGCLLYTSPSPRDATLPRMPSSA